MRVREKQCNDCSENFDVLFRCQYNNSDWGRVLELRQNGLSIRKIAKEVGISSTSVHNICK